MTLHQNNDITTKQFKRNSYQFTGVRRIDCNKYTPRKRRCVRLPQNVKGKKKQSTFLQSIFGKHNQIST